VYKSDTRFDSLSERGGRIYFKFLGGYEAILEILKYSVVEVASSA
jgi:hypothetical protein